MSRNVKLHGVFGRMFFKCGEERCTTVVHGRCHNLSLCLFCYDLLISVLYKQN